MGTERKRLRGVVLCEDRQHEQFLRALLDHLGYDSRHRFRFRPAPAGKGDAKQWIRAQYPTEVKALRSNNYQRLALVAMRDGDNVGFGGQQSDLDDALVEAELSKRQGEERIALPVPTWSIETWLLALLGIDRPHEAESRKHDYAHEARTQRSKALVAQAVRAWSEVETDRLPSLENGQEEMKRLDR
jgi:hypothetical protein